jgi:hypothetical protein
LKDMPLKTLSLDSVKCASFDGLRGLSLEWFNAGASWSSSIATIEAIRGMKLKGFRLDHFPEVTDLSPLQGQPLECLYLYGCGVADLSPIKDAHLRLLKLSPQTRVRDIRFLEWWPALSEFSGADDIVEAQLLKPAVDAISAGDEDVARKMMAALDSRFQNAPWLGRNLLFRDLKSGQLAKFAHWVKGDRSEVARELQVHGGHAYLFMGTKMQWPTAKEFAERLGGHLVTITSKSEDDFVRNELIERRHADCAWMGLESAPKVYGWKWITGEPFDYQDWDTTNGSGGANRGDDQNHACWHPTGHGLHWQTYKESDGTGSIVEWETPNPQDLPPVRVPTSTTARRGTAPSPSPSAADSSGRKTNGQAAPVSKKVVSEPGSPQGISQAPPSAPVPPSFASSSKGTAQSQDSGPVRSSAQIPEPSRAVTRVEVRNFSGPASRLDELREHAASMTESVLGSLERETGASFRGYISDLREDVLDEAARKPAASPGAYSLAVQLCNSLIAVATERDVLIARLNNNKPTNAAGSAAVTKVHPNWIDLERERDEAARATHNNTLETTFHKQITVQWGLRAAELRKTFDSEIAQFRMALRQSPPPR